MGPPRRPAFPAPETRSRVPPATPAGTGTGIASMRDRTPSAPHAPQGRRRRRPVPPQSAQVRENTMCPRIQRVWPAPAQVEQRLSATLRTPAPPQAPHAATRVTVTPCVPPRIAWSNVIRRAACRSTAGASPGGRPDSAMTSANRSPKLDAGSEAGAPEKSKPSNATPASGGRAAARPCAS